MRILGVDFSSAPSKRKPIVVAAGTLEERRLVLHGFEPLASLDAFEDFLRRPGPWIGGFDFPFALPRAFLLDDPALPRTWAASMAWLRATPREALRARFRAYCDARPPGSKFAHRATDRIAGSSPSMKWVNPPVAWMLREGAPRLLDACVEIPGLHAGDRTRVALEAYPGVVARAITPRSYKSDERKKQTAERRAERVRILDALRAGAATGVTLVVDDASARAMLDEPQGDVLDAAICALQAASATLVPAYGIPTDVEPLEGWIVGCPDG